MDIFAGCDLCNAAFIVPIAADAEGTILTRSAAGADTMAVTVKDVRSEIAFDGPVAESVFEGDEGREGLINENWRHMCEGVLVHGKFLWH